MKYTGFLVILITLLLLLPVAAPAAEVPVRLNLYEEGGVLTKQVKSLKEMRQRQMITPDPGLQLRRRLPGHPPALLLRP